MRAMTVTTALALALAGTAAVGTPAAHASSAGQAALAAAPQDSGKAYQLGATGPTRFDCSGFVKSLFAKQGVELPRTSSAQYAAVGKVAQAAKQPGDLIFTFGRGGIYHVGLYAGGDKMWAATKRGDTVRQQTMWTSQYKVGRV
jgi:cell wall-associated NlpC family hydrolase